MNILYFDCYYYFVAIGVYKIRMYIRHKGYFDSEPIMGFEKEAKEEINILLSGVFNILEIKELHNWKQVD